MKIDEAMGIVGQVFAMTRGTLQDHQNMQEAREAIDKALKPPKPMPRVIAAEEPNEPATGRVERKD